MIFTNAAAPGHPIIFVNQALLTLTEYDEHELLGQGFDCMLDPATDDEVLVQIQTAFEGGRDLDTQARCRRKDGSVFWVTALISPVRDLTGAVVQHFASFVDITVHNRKSASDPF